MKSKVGSNVKRSVCLFLFIFQVAACQTSGEDDLVLDENYFQRDGYLQYAQSEKSDIRPEDLGLVNSGEDVVLEDAPSDGSCHCSEVKVCPGKPLPKPFGGTNFAKTVKIIPPRPSGDNNRYYYLRSCDDSPEKLAFFIWGDRSRGAELLSVVGGRQNWKPGKVIRYKSPIRPEDSGMNSFYTDHKGIPKFYTVKKGDSLASISAEVYGDVRSWKELALYNSLDTPDSLYVGQKLKLNYKE